MGFRFSIIALGALCCLFSGCGCSKEKKPDDVVPSRMEDAAYTNRLVGLRSAQKDVASRMADIRVKLAKLGEGAAGTPEYAALTNQLVQCLEEAGRLRKTTMNVIRTRIHKEAAQKKGNLNK